MPDLAFSELTFLNSRRAKPDEAATAPDKHASKYKKRRKSSKEIDTDAKISRFFIASKAADHNAKEHEHRPRQQSFPTDPRDRDVPSPIVDLPPTPFLGFGSCGANSISPSKVLDSPAMKDLEKRLQRSPTHSTNYLTWSQSESPPRRLSKSQSNKGVPLVSSRMSNQNLRSPVLNEAESLGPKAVSPQSDKVSHKKQNATRNSAPMKSVTSKSLRPVSPSPQLETENMDKAAPSEKLRETLPTGSREERDSSTIRYESVLEIQNPTCPKQLQDDIRPIGKERAEDEAGKTCPDQAHETLSCNEAENLADILHSVLRDCRTERPVDKKWSNLQHGRDNPERSRRSTDSNVDQLRMNSSHSGGRHSHRSPSSPDIRVCAEDHGHCNEIATEAPQFEPQKVSTVLPNHCQTSSLRPPSNNRSDSRSAWTAYKSLYEQQQNKGHPEFCSDDNVAHVGRYNNASPRNESEAYQNRPGMEYEQLGDDVPLDDDWMRRSAYAVAGDPCNWPDQNACSEYEIHDTHGERYENLFARYKGHGTGNVPIYDSLEEHLELDLDGTEPHLRLADQSYGSNGHTFMQSVPDTNGGSGLRSDYNDGENGMEDPALSNFWTPHRLY